MFKIDKSKLDDTKFDKLLILWYDEENQIFKEMETIHDEANSTVSLKAICIINLRKLIILIMKL